MSVIIRGERYNRRFGDLAFDPLKHFLLSHVTFSCHTLPLSVEAMSKHTQHVVRSLDGWSVKKGGAKRASKTFGTQREAIAYGRQISKNQRAELYIHRKDGMIMKKNSYGNNPNPPRDKR